MLLNLKFPNWKQDLYFEDTIQKQAARYLQA